MEPTQRAAIAEATPAMLADDTQDTLKWLALAILGMVDDEKAVSVEAVNGLQGGVTYHVNCAPSDLGKLIGKQGRNARALRCLLTARGRRTNQSFTLNIVEERTTEALQPWEQRPTL